MKAGHVVGKIFLLIILFISNIPTFVFFDLFLARIMHHAARFCTSDAEARATAPTG